MKYNKVVANECCIETRDEASYWRLQLLTGSIWSVFPGGVREIRVFSIPSNGHQLEPTPPRRWPPYDILKSDLRLVIDPFVGLAIEVNFQNV